MPLTYKHYLDAERMPLADRQFAREAVRQAMQHPEYFALEVEHVILGNYGEDAMLDALSIVSRPRCNRVAQLGQLTGVLAFNCPPRFSAQAWKSLSGEEQGAVDSAVQTLIDHYAVEDK